MNKLTILTFAAVVFMGISFMGTGARATLFDVTEKIRGIDKAGHEIMLADGWYYIVPADLRLDKFKVGDEVTVTAHNYHDGLAYVETMTKEK